MNAKRRKPLAQYNIIIEPLSVPTAAPDRSAGAARRGSDIRRVVGRFDFADQHDGFRRQWLCPLGRANRIRGCRGGGYCRIYRAGSAVAALTAAVSRLGRYWVAQVLRIWTSLSLGALR